MELGRQAGLGSRVEGLLAATAANCTMNDLEQRATMLDRAEMRVAAPGMGREPTGSVLRDLAFTYNMGGHYAQALETAERAIAEEESWFGALTEIGHDSLVEAALAHTGLGDTRAARERAEQARSAARAMELSPLPSAWALARAARADERNDEARALLSTALPQAGADCAELAFAQGELALVLEQIGDPDRARQLASEALESLAPRGAMTAAMRRELEALLHRAGPYR